jgi:hypothetical protein
MIFHGYKFAILKFGKVDMEIEMGHSLFDLLSLCACILGFGLYIHILIL